MAVATLKLGAKMGTSFKTEIQCSNNFIIDQPKGMGGEGLGPNPMEVFLSSLSACICAVGKIIATQKRIKLQGINVEMEGDIDKDFLMGKTTEGEIRAVIDIVADITKEEKQSLVDEITRRCPIADNIRNTSVVKGVLK